MCAEKKALFDRLMPSLTGDSNASAYGEIAATLGLTEGAVKKAAQRLRGRYREILREEVARTVYSPDEVADEINDILIAVAC